MGAAGRGGRCEADLVITGFCSRESEAAGRGAALRHDPVVIVEDFLIQMNVRY